MLLHSFIISTESECNRNKCDHNKVKETATTTITTTLSRDEDVGDGDDVVVLCPFHSNP